MIMLNKKFSLSLSIRDLPFSSAIPNVIALETAKLKTNFTH